MGKVKDLCTDVKMVELSIPRASAREDPNLYISINGVNFLLPRGKKSLVPDYVAAEYERSQAALDTFVDSSERMTAK